MSTPSTRTLVRAAAIVACIVVAIVLLYIPAPWSQSRIINGVVIRSDVVQGSKSNGTRGYVVVRLDDGSLVSFSTSRATLPSLNTVVTIEENYGVFGQRLITQR